MVALMLSLCAEGRTRSARLQSCASFSSKNLRSSGTSGVKGLLLDYDGLFTSCKKEVSRRNASSLVQKGPREIENFDGGDLFGTIQYVSTFRVITRRNITGTQGEKFSRLSLVTVIRQLRDLMMTLVDLLRATICKFLHSVIKTGSAYDLK